MARGKGQRDGESVTAPRNVPRVDSRSISSLPLEFLGHVISEIQSSNDFFRILFRRFDWRMTPTYALPWYVRAWLLEAS